MELPRRATATSCRIAGRLALTTLALTIALLLAASPAGAQRASENVVTTAQDAFGTSIGNDTIGIYSAQEARGFSPREAGNMRIEGLYYDQQGNVGYGNQLFGSTTIRVGLSAQSYPFPAPTGIADVRLRLPRDKTQTSFSAFQGPYNSHFGAQADLETPLVADRLSASVSVGAGQKEFDFHTVFYYVEAAGMLHWRPNDETEVISFAQMSDGGNGEGMSLIFTGGPYLPPKIDRSIFFGPDFHQDRHRTQSTVGAIARSTAFDNWRIQTAVFRSAVRMKSDYAAFFRNTQPDGIADLSMRANPSAIQRSYSGETRASGVFAAGPFRHTVHFSAKGRSVTRTFGGDTTVALGPAMIGVLIPLPKPVFNFGPQSRDSVSQGTLGAAYVAEWRAVGEISAGVQKPFYRRSVDYPVGPNAVTRSSPWLYNGTAAAYLSETLTFYAGYTRGLEESGIAPLNASNAGEAQPASLTEQIDAGLRYAFRPGLTLVAGVFEVSKPYFDRDAANFFTRVGALRHRGVEMSLSGQPIEGLKVVVGTQLLQARVSGFTVDQGLIGPVPPGRTPVLVRLNGNYGPAGWRGFSLNGQVNFEDSQYANRINNFRIPSATVLDLGARYDFKAMSASASLRFDVRNVTNLYGWTVNGSAGNFMALPPRRYSVRMAADF